MKTTLKRGYGRGAAVDGNGNGHGTLPPLPTVVTRYKQPEPPRRSGLALIGRILVGALLLVLMVGAGLAGGAYLYFHQSVAAVVAHTPDVKKAAKQLDIPVANRAAIALVVGYDHRMGVESAGPSRSDTLMLLRADPQTKTISLLSFPRDLLVEQYCPDDEGNPVPRGHGKISGAYALCGAPGSLLTVKELTGLPINYLITVDFHGFKEIVNRVHGVWMDIDRRYYNKNVGTAATNYANINLHPGYQRLNGQQALEFVRYRHTDSDLYRLARQQEFVKALKQQVSDQVSFRDLPKLVTAVTDNVEVGEGGNHTLQPSTVLSYALFAYELPNGHFFQARISPNDLGQDANYNLTASPEVIQKAILDFETPDVEASEKATAVALGRKLKTKAPPPRATTVYVLNGNGVPGAAATASTELGGRGYRVVTSDRLANAPTQDYYKTQVYWSGGAKAKAAAQPLANILAPAEVAPLPRELRPLAPRGTMLTVVVGSTFHGELPAATTNEPPKREPAVVRSDAGVADDTVRADAPKLDFPAYIPTIVERSSRLDYTEPARLYTVHGHSKALRLTFRTGSSEYWGIQESDWDGAPALAKPSETRTLKDGRTYDLYYVGSKLHMVVLRGPGDARYWVVNSLLDALSNETMLAIAKGLKPLPK